MLTWKISEVLSVRNQDLVSTLGQKKNVEDGGIRGLSKWEAG